MKTHPDLEHPHQLRMSILMTPDSANFSGKVHGGHILKLLDQVAYACASRYCGQYVVTLAVDQVLFRQSVNVGEIATFLASINYTGRTSLEVGIKVIAEDPRQRKARHVISCFFTMVAMDHDHKPVAVPKLKPVGAAEKRRWREAERRRELKQELEERHRQIRSVARRQARG